MIRVNGQVLTLKDHLFPTDKLLTSSDKCNKLIAQGASGYWHCSVQPDTVENEEMQSPVSDPVNTLLHQFQDIFQPLVGLPPLTGYYKRFMPRYAHMYQPLHSADVGITLRVTSIVLPLTARPGAHEDTRRPGGPLGRFRRRILQEQGKKTNNTKEV